MVLISLALMSNDWLYIHLRHPSIQHWLDSSVRPTLIYFLKEDGRGLDKG